MFLVASSNVDSCAAGLGALLFLLWFWVHPSPSLLKVMFLFLLKLAAASTVMSPRSASTLATERV